MKIQESCQGEQEHQCLVKASLGAGGCFTAPPPLTPSKWALNSVEEIRLYSGPWAQSGLPLHSARVGSNGFIF